MYGKIDPRAAWAAAASLAQTGRAVSALTTRVRPLVPDHGYWQSVERSLPWWESTANGLLRRIAEFERNRPPVTGPTWSPGPPRAEHLDSPYAAATFFAGLASIEAMALAERFPDLIGPTEGAPLHVRYRANHLLALRYLTDLRARRSHLENTGWAIGDWWDPMWSKGEEVADLDRRIADAERWVDEDRQFLTFDPSADGRIVEVLGRIETSQHLAIVVPGVGNDLTNYEHGFRNYARSLHDELDGADAAVVAWLGYDTPDHLLAATDPEPGEAAAALSQLLEGLDNSIDHALHTSIIGHSYGSLVTGLTLRVGGRADEVVFVGSPGVGVDHVSEFGLPASTRVWASRADADPIQFARDLECLDLVPICYPAKDRLYFGSDPTDRSFGAIEFAAGSSSFGNAHSAYFGADSLSLRNLASIVLGQDRWVTKPSTPLTVFTE